MDVAVTCKNHHKKYRFYSKMAFTTAFSHSICYFNYTNSHKQIKIKLMFKIVKFLQDTAIASRKF